MTFKLPSPSGEEIEAAASALNYPTGSVEDRARVWASDVNAADGWAGMYRTNATHALVAARPVLEKELKERIEKALMVAVETGRIFGSVPRDEAARAAFWRVLRETEK